MSREKRYPPINVISATRGFPTEKLKLKITPYRFQLPDGRVHVGRAIHFHYVLQTREERYFHIVYDTSDLTWKLVQEVDEQLFFNE